MSHILATLTREGYVSEITEHAAGLVSFVGDLDIDADGACRAYHPQSRHGLDDLVNAKTTGGEWCGIVTARDGEPVIQGPHDPAPGFYVSPTSLHLRDENGELYALSDPRRYVDAATVPFMVVPPQIIKGVAGIVLGCRGRITDTRTGRRVDVVVADAGPRTKDGEASIAAARLLGIPSSARTGGEDEPVFLYECWPGQPAVIDGVTYPLQGS